MSDKTTGEVKTREWLCDGCGVNLFSRDGEYRYVTCDDNILIVLSGVAPPEAPPENLSPTTKHWCQSCIKIQKHTVVIGRTREGPIPLPTLRNILKDLGVTRSATIDVDFLQEPPDGS